MKADDQPTAPDPEALAAFLKDAPEELREWAAAQLPTQPEAAGDPAEAHDSADAEPADSDLALAELGEEDDEPRRRPKVHTPMDKEHTPVAPRPRKGGAPLVPILGILVVAALVYGIFRLGLPEETADQAAGGQPTATAQASDGAARMAELEAKLLSTPDDVAVNLELGVLHFNAGDSERAEELWTKVTKVDPRNPQAWFNLGFIHLADDPPDTEGAKADWDKVLEVAPESDLAATVRSHLDALDAMDSPTPTPTPTEK